MEELKEQEFWEEMEPVLADLSDVCNEEEMEELKESIGSCIVDGISSKSLLYMLSDLAKTGVITKLISKGHSVEGIINHFATYGGTYSNPNTLSTARKTAIEKIVAEYDETDESYEQEIGSIDPYDDEPTDPAYRKRMF